MGGSERRSTTSEEYFADRATKTHERGPRIHSVCDEIAGFGTNKSAETLVKKSFGWSCGDGERVVADGCFERDGGGLAERALAAAPVVGAFNPVTIARRSEQLPFASHQRMRQRGGGLLVARINRSASTVQSAFVW